MDRREGLCRRFSFSHLLSCQFATSNVSDSDPNAMETGPPTNDITAPPTSGGLGMIPAGLASVGQRATQNAGTMTIGGGSVDKFHPWILPPHLRLAPRVDAWFALAVSS